MTVGTGFDLRIASIPGLALLKLLAWVDKSESKQAQDVLRLIETYGDAGNDDLLYGDEIDLLEAEGFDFPLAGARLLAQDALALAAQGTIAIVQSLLRDAKRMNTLEVQKSGSKFRLDDSIADQSGIRFRAFANTFLSAERPFSATV